MGLADFFARVMGRKPGPDPAVMRKARPIKRDHVDLVEGDDGVIYLEIPRSETQQDAKWFARPHRFELEPIGADVWRRCDGKTSVETIAKALASTHSLTLREAEVALVSFLRTLGERGLIVLELPQSRKKR